MVAAPGASRAIAVAVSARADRTALSGGRGHGREFTSLQAAIRLQRGATALIGLVQRHRLCGVGDAVRSRLASVGR